MAHGDHFQAEAQLKEALYVCKQIGHRPQAASVLRYSGHVATAKGGSHLEEAKDYYLQSLILTRKYELAAIAMDIFVGLAGILVPEDKADQRVIELLSMANSHPASTHATKLAAEKQLAELTSETTEEPLKEDRRR